MLMKSISVHVKDARKMLVKSTPFVRICAFHQLVVETDP